MPSNHLRRFQYVAGYQQYKVPGMRFPSVSTSQEDRQIHYDPDYRTMHLSVKCLGENGGTLRLTNNENVTEQEYYTHETLTILPDGLLAQVSLDNGATWVTAFQVQNGQKSYTDITMQKDDVAMIRGNFYMHGEPYSGYGRYSVFIDLQDANYDNVPFSVYGNFGSLFWMDDFMRHYNDPIYDYRLGWSGIFETTGITEAHVAYPNITSLYSTYAFEHCTALEEATICEGTYFVGDSDFKDCANLRKLTLPSTINFIGRTYSTSGSYGCAALTTVVCYAVVPPEIGYYNASYNEYPLIDANVIQHIYVPDESVNLYKSAERWDVYASKIFPISSMED